MIICNHLIAPRRGNEPLAQGNALCKERRNNRPERAKALLSDKAFALWAYVVYSIPRALPWAVSLLAFQAAYRVHADNHIHQYASPSTPYHTSCCTYSRIV